MKNEEIYRMVTDRITALLEQGDVPWRKPWGSAGNLPMNLVSKQPYRGVNVWLLGSLKYDSPYWLTFKQAKTKGGHIRKGEKAAPVVFWKTYDRKNADGETVKFFILRYYNVFNVAQCEGVKVPDVNDSTPGGSVEPIRACQDIVDAWDDAPVVRHGFSGAWYAPGADEISMPDRERFDSSEKYYSTLFHEMTHSTGHKKRLNRPTLVDMVRFGDTNYSKEELVAEMGASYLCGVAGIENYTVDNSAAYIKHWLGRLRDDSKLFLQAASQAQKATDYILGATKTTDDINE